ncbi:ABC transporter ATP-binding protein [Pusillimonas caeni]|uniref:ABC transporter ATP-binding protein n=1 Tax=Pusillimonas caeni TaxID=1348472 RepID=UPI000E59A8D2|nr:ABC transporter ATP-binding protein [Pusillimonas caeni]TFL14785.1 ABC transporter ATP-binding protein [Pusillimonas caeni]
MMSTYLDISDFTKVYPSPRGDVHALESVNLGIEEGQFVSILGPSGCGKSTLLKCVAGLESGTCGQIRFDGQVLDGPPSGLGMVFQRDLLVDWRTVLENVMITAEFLELDEDVARKEALRLLELFGLKGFEHHHPWELSGGMRQRAAICRALVGNPRLLLMDEPFGALDAMTRDELNIELQHIWLQSKKTLLFVTHSIQEAVFLSDRVIVMSRNPARVIEDMTIDLPRPRTLSTRGSAQFGEYVIELQALFKRVGIFKGE